ncbi:hypothetical protein GCM10027317_26120 [Massilia agri]
MGAARLDQSRNGMEERRVVGFADRAFNSRMSRNGACRSWTRGRQSVLQSTGLEHPYEKR